MSKMTLSGEEKIQDLTSLRNQTFRFHDTATKNKISIGITESYLSIKINNRCYYFNTDDGRYDGYSDEVDITVDGNLPSHIEVIFSC